MIKKENTPLLLLSIISFIFFFSFNGNLHLFDWDEINFAECAREMIITNDFLNVRIFFEPFWEKPPLFIWFQVLAMKIFGINEFAARFPNAICGVATILCLYKIGRKVKDNKFAYLWIASYLASILPFFYFKSGIIDPWFNLFIFISISYYLFAQNNKHKYKYISISGMFLGLAVLTKGPAAIIIFGITVFTKFILQKFKLNLKAKEITLFILSLTFIGGLWFILQIVNGNWQTIIDFVVYQIRLFQTKDAGHGGFPLYHFVVLLIGVFPASVFAIKSLKRTTEGNKLTQDYKMSMVILFWVVLILFSIVKTKIVHYSSMAYFPITFLSAYTLYNVIENKKTLDKWIRVSLISLSSLFALIVVLASFFEYYKDVIFNKITVDKFTEGNLSAISNLNGTEAIIGLIIFVCTLISINKFKKGDNLKATKILFIGTFLFTYLTILCFPSNIEKYTQNAVIEFYENHKNEDVYFQTSYKSYAMLFYAKPQPLHNKQFNKEWLLKGDIDKDVYFVMKNKDTKYFTRYKDLKLLYEKNGFLFCKRSKTINHD